MFLNLKKVVHSQEKRKKKKVLEEDLVRNSIGVVEVTTFRQLMTWKPVIFVKVLGREVREYYKRNIINGKLLKTSLRFCQMIFLSFIFKILTLCPLKIQISKIWSHSKFSITFEPEITTDQLAVIFHVQKGHITSQFFSGKMNMD